MITTQMDASNCPDCGKKLNAATDIESDAIPEPGDIGVCLYCQGVHIFTETMGRRLPTEQEIASIPFLSLSQLQNKITTARENDSGSE